MRAVEGGSRFWPRLALSGFVCIAAVAAALCGAPNATTADLSSPQPWWGLSIVTWPTGGQPGARGTVAITVENLGDGASSGQITITATLPPGVRATAIEASPEEATAGGAIGCTLATLTCTSTSAMKPYRLLEVQIAVNVEVATEERVLASVSGGGAPRSVEADRAIVLGGAERFGIEAYALTPEAAGGTVDARAGSHPFQLTSVLAFDAGIDAEGNPAPIAAPKEIETALPAGLVADTSSVTQCSTESFLESSPKGCPPQAAVGVAAITVAHSKEPGSQGVAALTVPIYSLTPPSGMPASFAVGISGVGLILEAELRAGSDYGITIVAHDVSQAVVPLAVRMTFWGVPGDPLHDSERGQACVDGAAECLVPAEASASPFLTMPTSCQAPFESVATASSWGSPARPSEEAQPLSYRLPEALSGCGNLPFAPTIAFESESVAASTPTGLAIDVHMPREGAANPQDAVESTVGDFAIALPEGFALDPAATSWLQGCTESEAGFLGVDGASGASLFTSAGRRPSCPGSSKIGRLEIDTPLLAKPLIGGVYLASPKANPFGGLVAIYAIAEEPQSGVGVKLVGDVSLNPDTGQLAISLSDLPQLPFSELNLELAGGPRAPLSTPAQCGAYGAQATFTPWSGKPPVAVSATIRIMAGLGGGACPGTLPFQPSLTAGMQSSHAASSSPFVAELVRQDGERPLGGLALTMPPGLSADLARVAPCGEPAAAQGQCGAASEIGTVQLALGIGPEPAWLGLAREDPVYLTAPYDGKGACTAGHSGCAPFGLAIVIDPVAGPFDLSDGGRPVVVRATVKVDQTTARLRIATKPFPRILDGVPLQIRRLVLDIDRPGFMRNPTSCAPMRIDGLVESAEGTSAPVSNRFQAAGCAGLRFSPGLSATTPAGGRLEGHGAGLHVTVSAGATGAVEANLRSIRLTLPRRLVARGRTIQHACPEGVFAVDPASCSSGSLIGYARVYTAILGKPLAGPAFLLAREGAAARRNGFPRLMLVLQGEGIRIDLAGRMYVSARNVTSATFPSIPDIPVRRLDLHLPEGGRSLLAAAGHLCRRRNALRLQVRATGQNGARLRRGVKIAVRGCRHRRLRAQGRRSKYGERRRGQARRHHARRHHARHQHARHQHARHHRARQHSKRFWQLAIRDVKLLGLADALHAG